LKRKYDVILVDSVIALECAYFLRRLFSPRIKVVFYVVDPTFWPGSIEKKKIRKMFHLMLGTIVDGFLVPSEMMANDVKKYFPKKKIQYAPTFLWRDAKKLRSIMPDLKSKKMIMVAQNRPEKGVDNLVNAYAKARKIKVLPELFLIGENTKKYKKRSIPGLVAIGRSEHVLDYLKKSTFLLHPAKFDPSPNVIPEAMAAGVIPVVSRHCGNYKAVESISKKLLFDGIDSESIRCKIEEIQSISQSEIKNFSKNARLISSDFEKEKGIKIFVRSFNEIVAGVQSKKRMINRRR